jgi:DNA-directed RNA polymerase subunit RPC12/RpoP
MLVKVVCSKCRRRVYFVELTEGGAEYCPKCGSRLEPRKVRKDVKKSPLDVLLEKLPLTDVGSRERPFYLEERELLLLGQHLVDSISMMEEWAKRPRQQLEREAQELKRLIAYLEEKGRDPLLREIEFLMLSSFIRNHYG